MFKRVIMKTLMKYILLVSIFASLAACQKQDFQENQNVKIFVSINSETQTRVNHDATALIDGDQLVVLNTSRKTNNRAVFVYNESYDEWVTSDNIMWEGKGDNVFKAWHPATAEFETFTIPFDQTSGLNACDWMTAIASAKIADGGVSLKFNRHLTKVNVMVTGWGNEFGAEGPIIDNVDLISLSGTLTNDGVSVTGDATPVAVRSYYQPDKNLRSAIIAPGEYSAGDDIIKVYINGNEIPLLVKASEGLNLKAGMAYTLKLYIGKDRMEITSDDVSVERWDDETLTNQEILSGIGSQPTGGSLFDKDRYIIYENYGQIVVSGDDYYSMNPYFKSRVPTISEIEMKFQLPSASTAYLFHSEMENFYNGVLTTSEGLVFRWDNSRDVTNEKVLTWSEIGIPPTVPIVLNISLSRGVATINGREFSIPEVQTFRYILYLFSAYEYIDDSEGWSKRYFGVPSGTKLYYAKIMDENGGISYHGYAAQVEDSNGIVRNVWKSEYNGRTYYEYPRTNFEGTWIHTYSSSWRHFEGGVDENSKVPVNCIDFEYDEVKYACLAAFDTDGDNELSYDEAAAVKDISTLVFPKSSEVSFNEFKCFTSVTEIPKNFFNRANLTSIEFPLSLKKIGEYGFYSCTKLTSVTLPENITLDYGAFSRCSGLTEVTVPSGTEWVTDAFYCCTSLTKAIIKSGVTYIPECAFQGCSNLTYVSIPSTVTELRLSVFRDCTSLRNIQIPNSVTVMKESVFYGCSQLVSVSLSENLTTVPYNCFYNCSSLKEITIPSKVEVIDRYAFAYCSALTTVYAKATTPPGINSDSFYKCTNLSSIYVPSSSYSNYYNNSNWSTYRNYLISKTY